MASKEFYEEFHTKTQALSGIPTPAEFTYGNPIAFIRRNVDPGDRVLDVGCGNGVLSIFAASLGCEVVALDISDRAIEVASRGSRQLRLKDITFVNTDFSRFETTKRFDTVLCFDVLEHIPDDDAALDAVVRVLRPGGRLLVRVPSSSAFLHRLRVKLTGHDRFDESVGHLRRYLPRELSRLLVAHGFKIIEIEPVEGWLRNMLFTTCQGSRFLRYAVRPNVGPLVTAADNIALRLFGDSGFNVAAVRSVELT